MQDARFEAENISQRRLRSPKLVVWLSVFVCYTREAVLMKPSLGRGLPWDLML